MPGHGPERAHGQSPFPSPKSALDLCPLLGVTQADCDQTGRSSPPPRWPRLEPRLWKVPEWLTVGAAPGKLGRSRRRPAAVLRLPGPLGRARWRKLRSAGLETLWSRDLGAAAAAFGASPADRLPTAGPMQRLAMDLRMLSRELSLYLEHQVRVGFFGSGVGLSLILGFSVAYACYYLSSIAKVSQGLARARGRRAAGGFAASHSSRTSWN